MTLETPPDQPTRPRSEAQRDAARRNGARSRGPGSAAGKARSAGNALKHGLTARVLLPDEAEEGLAALRETVAAALPGGVGLGDRLLDHLVDQLAAVVWRRDRAVGLETDAVAVLLERPIDDDPATLAAERRLALMIRYQAHLGRELARGLQLLAPAPTDEPRKGRASGSFRHDASTATPAADLARDPAAGSGSFRRPTGIPSGPIVMPAGEGLGTDFLKDCLGDGFDDFIAREHATRAELVASGLLAPDPTDPPPDAPSDDAPVAEAAYACTSFGEAPSPDATRFCGLPAAEPITLPSVMPATLPLPAALQSEPAPAAPTAAPAAEESPEQAIARLLRDPQPRRPGDAVLADAIYFAATQGDPWYQGPFELWRLREALLPLHPHPDVITRLGSTAFADAAQAIEGRA